MTADFEQPSSDLPELPEAIRHLGEGSAGDAFRELYAEMVKEFTPQEIFQVIGDPDRAKEARALANWKTILEDSGWTVVTGSTSESDSFPLDRSTMIALIPTLEHYLRADDRLASSDEDIIIFVEPPTELSDFEKEQAAARPVRYSGLPDDFILFRPDAKTIDHRLKDLLGWKLDLGRQEEAKVPQGTAVSDQLAAFELLRTDEEAAAVLREKRQANSDGVISRTMEKRIPKDELHTPTPAEFRAEYAGLLSRLEFLEGRAGRTSGQSTQRWLAEYDRMIDAQATAAPEKTEQAADIVPVPTELWHALRGVLGYPNLEKALVWLAEEDGLPPYWYSEEVKWIRDQISALDVEESDGEADPSESYGSRVREVSAKLRSFVENQVKPPVDAATERAIAEGNRVHDLVERTYREKGFSGTVVDILFGKLDSKGIQAQETAEAPKPTFPSAEEPAEGFRTIKDLSADFSVQDLIADYDESKLPGAVGYITLEGNRFPKLYAQLVELFTTEGFSDRDRLVGLLGLLDGYEASEDYSTGDAYHISRIRQLLKRR